MKANYLTVRRLPTLLATAVLSMGLLLSACSNSDSDDKNSAETAMDTENSTNEAAANTQEAEANEPLTAAEAEDILENEGVQITDSIEDKDKTIIDSDDINPMTADAEQPSLITSPTEVGTPEDTVKQALDTLYYGDVKDAVSYYKVDMANFEEEMAKTQYAFQQTVEGVTIINTKYNSDKTKATINGELMLKGQKEPAPLSYELEKVAGKWKILG